VSYLCFENKSLSYTNHEQRVLESGECFFRDFFKSLKNLKNKYEANAQAFGDMNACWDISD
jgi:hypothetical protein